MRFLPPFLLLSLCSSASVNLSFRGVVLPVSCDTVDDVHRLLRERGEEGSFRLLHKGGSLSRGDRLEEAGVGEGDTNLRTY